MGQEVPAAPDERVHQEHRAILRMLEDVAACTQPAQLLVATRALDDLLRPHFAEEESHLFPGIRAARPELDRALRSLEREHQDLSDAVRGLLDQLADLEIRRAATLARRDDLLERIRSHERTESALLADAWLVDLGGSE